MKNLGITCLLLISILTAYGQKDKKIVEKTVKKASIEAHLKFLSSDALRGRDTPSQGLEVAATYIKTQLELYGVKAFPEYPDYLQPVSMREVIKPSSGVIKVGEVEYTINKDFVYMNGQNMDWQGEYVMLEYANPDELEGLDLTGKLVVANAGDGESQSPRAWYRMRAEKAANVKAAGGVGLIELYNSQMAYWQILLRYLNRDGVSLDSGDPKESFLSLWVNDANRVASKVFSATDQVSVTISGADNVPFEVYNVVGYVEGTDDDLKNTYVAYSAHYDHVGVGRPDSTGDDIYNGARDNAVGTVTVIEAAKSLAKYPTKRSSLFVLFAGEEKGLLGSEWFVNHPPMPLSDIVFCFNSDNGGYNDTTIATIIGLDRTTAKKHFVTGINAFGLGVNDDSNYKEQNLFDRSDNVSFASKGIPAPSFGLGVTEFDDQVLSTYHQPSDEFETLDLDYLYTFYKAYLLTGRLIANDKETHFWVEGDKYYETGKALYR